MTQNKKSFIKIETMKPIKKGEEITINYLFDQNFLFDSKRNKQLKKKLLAFECKCIKCVPQTSFY